ncbi:hypothetical protein CLV51_11033 [Chitinophaga niastensis]|uniref:Uncharacterized protein n=1 Tax=Chitinophaga niastensis TaxID=536980 RepID=A0A2P8H9A7_CHINA|nr:hypothetical protein CLV51_11033 [Chitinophaga niastensis]
MFYLFKKKIQTNSSPITDGIAQQINLFLHKIQVICAAYLSQKEMKLKISHKRALLLLFAIITCTFFIYLVIAGISGNDNAIPIRQPIHLPQIDTPTKAITPHD